MKKLKNKVFLVIFLILTLFTTGILCAYNAQLYAQERQSTERSLSQASEMGIFGGMLSPRSDSKRDEEEKIGNIRFMDNVVYTVLLDSDNSIFAIINHSGNGTTDDEIETRACEILNRTDGDVTHIGNLYFADYSYALKSGDSLVMIDNASTNQRLTASLEISLTILILAEIIIFLVSKRLTKWITNPVAESFEKQKQFIADASHELKTPLAVIMASSEALEHNPLEEKWLNNIKSESDRMNKLISDLLDLAKSEEMNDKTEFAPGNLSKEVEKSVLTFEGIMFEKGISLKDTIEENIAINMNAYKIKQLMSILLDNAIQHSNEGGEIEVCLKREKDIVLTVKNKGEGIPKGEEEKIFERFYRADASRNRNENRYGLGLAIAKNIAESHHAEITAASDNGYTTFKVVFR